MVCAALIAGCGDLLGPPPRLLFTVPLELPGSRGETAIVDTGGGYELMLRGAFGLAILGETEVIVLGGRETVTVASGFPYRVGDIQATADLALVGVSVCDCNGLGFQFFRKSGLVPGFDFPAKTVTFLSQLPVNGITLEFDPPPDNLVSFDAAFLDVDVSNGGETRVARALVDTGTTVTALRRGFIGRPGLLTPELMNVTMSRRELGSVSQRVRLFDNGGLPDLILGTDVMSSWADEWYFSFTPRGGLIRVVDPRPGAAARIRPAASRF